MRASGAARHEPRTGHSPAHTGGLAPILVWRFVRGMAPSSGRILANAAARDLYDREMLGRTLSLIMMVGASVSLITGPAGGLIVEKFPWQADLRHWLAITAPMTLYMFGFALILPQISAGALTPFPRTAGSASSLQGFMLSVTLAAVSALLALFADGTALPMTAAILISAIAVRLVYMFAIRPVKMAGGD